MAAQPWFSKVRSTPIRPRHIRAAKRVLATLLGLGIVYTAIMGLTISAAAGGDAKLKSQLEDSLRGSAGNDSLFASIAVVGLACAGLLWLERHRLGSAEKFAVEEQMEIEREALELVLQARLAEEHKKLSAWKNEQISAIYQRVLDQQARGLLPCPNCRHGEHRKSA